MAQTYFAIQTRKQELSEKDYSELSEDEKRFYQRNLTKKGNYSLNIAAKNAGVKNFDKFHNYGYKGLYNGETANDIAKRKELEDTIIILENRLKKLEENSKNQSISLKAKINILKQKVDMLLNIDTNEISDVLIDSIVDKITVYNDRYEWKINYISSSSEDYDENSNGVFFARMIITVDEIKRYNDKKRILKKVFQKDPIVMDIYI